MYLSAKTTQWGAGLLIILSFSWNLKEGAHTVLGKTSLQVFWAHTTPGPTSSMCDGCDVLHRKGNCQLCFRGNSYGSDHSCCVAAQLSLSPDLQWMIQIHIRNSAVSFKGHFMHITVTEETRSCSRVDFQHPLHPFSRATIQSKRMWTG